MGTKDCSDTLFLICSLTSALKNCVPIQHLNFLETHLEATVVFVTGTIGYSSYIHEARGNADSFREDQRLHRAPEKLL